MGYINTFSGGSEKGDRLAGPVGPARPQGPPGPKGEPGL